MASTVKSYFDHHAQDYTTRHDRFYDYLVEYLVKNIKLSKKLRLLDIGCGDGGFVKSLISLNIHLDYFLTDMSYDMLKFARTNLMNSDVTLFVADGLNLPLSKETRFDIIHIDSVLHHLINKNQTKSTNLIKKMIELLINSLSTGGILIVDEWYFLSYILPSLASCLIFYGLKFINRFKLDLSFVGEIKPGLEVNFLTPEKLLNILSAYGNASTLKRTKVEFPLIYKCFFVKEKGRISCILKNDTKFKNFTRSEPIYSS